jgi:type VI secretion system protein ImpE
MLGRATEWIDAGGIELGIGQRLLSTDEADFGILDVRSLTFD